MPVHSLKGRRMIAEDIALLVSEIQKDPDNKRYEKTVILDRQIFNPQNFFISSSLFPKIFFKRKNSDEKIFALGMLPCRLSPDDSFRPSVIFRGLPFPDAKTENEWSVFPEEIDSYALILIRDSGNEISLTVCNEAMTDDERQQNSIKAVAALREIIGKRHFRIPSSDPEILYSDRITCIPAHDEYKKNFEELKNFFFCSPDNKVVLARRCLCNTGITQSQIMKVISGSENPDYAYLIAPDSCSCYAGFSPETLLKKSGKKISTEALAGTVSVNTDNASHLLQSSVKDNHENMIVSDWIVSRLAPLCSNIAVSDPEIITSGELLHIRRSVTGELLDETEDKEILKAIHPTPAMAGTPLNEALKLIGKYEKFSRGWYAGTLGIEEKNFSDYCVLIRGILLNSGSLHIYTGSGLICSSECTREWAELNAKFRSTVGAFGFKISDQKSEERNEYK